METKEDDNVPILLDEEERALQDVWVTETREKLERAYLEARTGPGGSGCSSSDEGWEAARRPLLDGFGAGGPWLDVGCANGNLIQTLPAWARERGLEVEPHGLELIPTVADAARRRNPHLRDRIWTGDVMRWDPPIRFSNVTTMNDPVPPALLGALVRRLLDLFVAPGGRVIISSYGSSRAEGPTCVEIAELLVELGFAVLGQSSAVSPTGRVVTRTAWVEAPR